MKNKKIKILGVTSAIMMAMGSLSFAASSNAFINANPNITAYNTAYNFTYTQNSGNKDEDLKVIAADPYWSVIKPFDTDVTAKTIDWTIIDGSTNALTKLDGQEPIGGASYTNYDGTTYEGYAAYAKAEVDTTKTPGVAVAEATNDYTSWNQYGSEFLEDVTINETSYEYSKNVKGWVYAVYNKDGSLNKVSEKVGGETFNVSDGQTVVWVFANYKSDYTANVTFPSKLSDLPTIN